MNKVKSIIPNFESLIDNDKINILLYGNSQFDENKNKIILEATINYLKNSERFPGSLFEQNVQIYKSITSKPLFVRNY